MEPLQLLKHEFRLLPLPDQTGTDGELQEIAPIGGYLRLRDVHWFASNFCFGSEETGVDRSVKCRQVVK